MIKGIKIFITVVFVILALLSGMMSFMIVGMGVSGSGCGQECFDNMDSAKFIREGANKQVISSQADSLIKISRIWADFFPANTSN